MKTYLLTLGLIAMSAATVSAVPPHHQEPRHSSHLKEASHESLQDNAPDGHKDAVPHFAIFGKEDKFYLGIGGTIKVTVGEDWGAPLDNPDEFITSEIEPTPDGSRNKFHLSAQQSSLFLNFVALPNSDNKIGGYVEMYFLNDYAPVLQYAYLKWRGLKAGYDYSTFSDNGAMPPTIDFEGPNAATAIPVPMISYTRNFGKNKAWSASIGLELPQYSITPNNYTHAVTQGIPDIPAAIKYSWNKGEDWLRASAIMRNLTYHNTPAGKNVDVVGWGVSLSGTSEIIPNLRGFWTGVYGRGIASCIQDLTGNNLDLTPRGTGQALKASKTWGAFGGLQYSFSPAVYCSATYSHVRNYAEPWSPQVGNSGYAGDYKYAQYVAGNVFWNINAILTTGIEYIYGRRVNNDGSQAHTNRMQAMIQLSF